MSSLRITIVDYGLGNIFNILRAVEYLGYKACFSSKYNDIINSDFLILPGVGAFEDGMIALKEKGLVEIIQEYVNQNKPLLGVCLGMQLLMSTSEEFGRHEGLNLINGEVVHFPKAKRKGMFYKIPHIGWNKIQLNSINRKNNSREMVLREINHNSFYYFTHSFIVQPNSHENCVALSNYGGIEFCSVINKGKIWGCQFHPELSGVDGLKFFKYLLES